MATNVDFILKNGLQVGANVKVGSGYVANLGLFAPVNGMLVEGFVGIGTMSASAPLTLTGNVALYDGVTPGGILFPDGTWQDTAASASAAGVLGSIQFNNGSGYFDYDPLLLWDTSTNRLGIGTTAPAGILHVVGDLPSLFDSKNSTDPTIVVGNTLTTGATLAWNVSGTYGSLKTGTGETDMIVWTNTGVGINNVTTPVNALDISGGAVIGGGIGYAGFASAPNNGLLVQGSVGIGTNGTPAGMLDIRPSAGQAGILIKNPSSSAQDFLRFLDSANAAKFTVTANGNVSVGTWTGTVIKANYGGTGLNSYAAGDILYATSSTEVLSKLAIAPTGNVLISNGTAPEWGKVSLTDAISGILPIANGGTNSTAAPTAGAVAYGDGTAYAFSAVGISGNVLLSGGAGAPTWGLSYTKDNVPNTIVVRDVNGDFAAGKITSNSGLVVTSGGANVTGDITATGTGTFQTLVSNSSISGTSAFVSTLQATGAATVNSLTSNGAIAGTTVTGTVGQFSTSLTGQTLVSNSSVSGTDAYFSTLQTSSGATVNSLTSNGAITGTSITGTTGQFSSTLTGQSVVSNSSISGQTASLSSTLQVGGTATVNELVSNGAVSGTSAYLTSLQTTGSATVNSLSSNTSVTAQTGNFTVNLLADAATVTNQLTVGGTALVNTLSSNGTITATSGGVNITGISQFSGNVNISGSLAVSGNINTVNSNVLVVTDPIIYVGEDNPANVWDLGIVASYTTDIYRHTGLVWNHTNDTWTLFDNLITEPTQTINWSQPGLTFGDFKAGNVTVAETTASTTWTNGALTVAGGAGIAGDLNVHGNINVDGAITLTNPNVTITAASISTDNLQVKNTATVQGLVSNTYVNGQTGYFTGTVNIDGATTVASLTSNGAVIGTNAIFDGTLQVTGAATVNSLTSNGAIAGTTVTGTSGQFSSTLTGQSIVSNSSINGQTGTFTGAVNISGTTTVNELVSNGAVTGTSATFTTIQGSGTATVNAIVSNGAITGTTVTGTVGQFSTSLTGQSIVSNSSINGQTGTFTGAVNISGTTTVNSLVSNGAISGTTISGTNAYLTSVQTSGTATVNELVSNGAVSGTTGTFNSTLTGQSIVSNSSVSGTGAYFSTLQTSSTATVNELVSNGAISGTTVTGTVGQFSTSLTGQTIVSNSSISGQTATLSSTLQVGGTATVNALVSNGAISGTTVTGTVGQFSTSLTGQTLVSNSSVSGTDAFFSTLQTSSGAVVNSLTSNGAVSGTTGTFSSTLTGQSIVSNSSITGQTGTFTGAVNISGTTTVNSLSSNGAVSGTNATFSSLTTSGTTTASAIVSNTTVSGNSFVIGGSVATTGGTGALTVDTWEVTKYRTVHYIAQVTDNTNVGDFHAAQFMILHNDTTPFKTEYSMMWTNAPLGSFDATITGGNVVVTFTATAATNKTVKVTRTGVTV